MLTVSIQLDPINAIVKEVSDVPITSVMISMNVRSNQDYASRNVLTLGVPTDVAVRQDFR